MSWPKPLLLVDIDGVLNPYAASSCPDGYCEYDLFPGEKPVRLAEKHGHWLRELGEDFDLIWATGWQEDPGQLISPILGIKAFPRIVFPPVPFDPAEKVTAIRSYVRDRPVAWVDDMITPEAGMWAAERRAPTLLVDVDPATGLTEPVVTELKNWAAALE